jgi:ABC-type branched-subunit amino acid transport system ATPase component
MTILEVRGLGKRFGGLPAVDGVDLDVEAGQVFAIIGPNGAGKSTLLKIMAGMLAPSASKGIVFEGSDLTGMEPHEVRHRGVAKVLQTPRVFDHMTVLENAALGAIFGGGKKRPSEAQARRRASEVLDLLDLGNKAGWEVGQLNLHEKRTLELARALAGQPRLLLLDEVMAGLNPSELDTYIRVVRKVRDDLGMTVVWVEHVMKAINALADHVFVLNFGQKLVEGPPEQVMRDQQVIEAYLGRGAHRYVDG